MIEAYGPALKGAQTGSLRGIIIGGRNEELLQIARRVFHDRFAGFHVADERVRLGFHPDNPVNLPSQHGVQIELPPAFAGSETSASAWSPSKDGVVTDTIAALAELSDPRAS